MERVLEQAVQHGAQMMGRTIQAMAPDLLLFSGPSRARGFKLEGYGFFFDVEVPALRRSVAWSVQMLNRSDRGVGNALDALRQHVQSMPSGPGRNTLEQALKRIELQVGPPPDMINGPEVAPSSRPAAAPPTVEGAAALQDPHEAYTNEVKRALVDAMLDHSGPIAVGGDEWITVAARGDESGLSPADVYEAQILVLRIRGADLSAFRADRLTRDEARLRVEVRQF
jgi:hypothetical protein